MWETPGSTSAGPNSRVPEVKGLARLIQDPVFVLDLQGNVLECNKFALSLVGVQPLGTRVFEADDGFRALIEAASGTSEPAIGSVTLRASEKKEHRFRARALVIDRSDSVLRIAVQILNSRDDQFAMLSRRVKELNKEIAERRSIQARLEESVGRNNILYRELQHRVKNHLQMTLGLFTAARRETSEPKELTILQRMEGKLQIVFEAQRLMYAHDAEGVQADQLLGSMIAVIAALTTEQVEFDLEADPVIISNDIAFPVALIANELLSNAAKYGTPRGVGRIFVSLKPVNGELELQVRDWGLGFTGVESNRRSSGLGLVRGLCRQIGGRLDITSEGGTVVRVRFPVGS